MWKQTSRNDLFLFIAIMGLVLLMKFLQVKSMHV